MLGVAAWVFSRAGKIRAFEGLLAQRLMDLQRRVEAGETKGLESYAALESVAGEATELFERIRRERKRVQVENTRAEQRDLGENGAPNFAAMSREEAKDAVRAAFMGQ